MCIRDRCIAFGMLIMNILVFYLIGDILEGEEKLRKEVLFRKRVKSEIDMYHQISENYNQQRKREHEYRNQMMVVGALVKDRKLEKLEAVSYTHLDVYKRQLLFGSWRGYGDISFRKG